MDVGGIHCDACKVCGKKHSGPCWFAGKGGGKGKDKGGMNNDKTKKDGGKPGGKKKDAPQKFGECRK